MATTRAGALLDLFEMGGDAKLLALADRAAKAAYALGPQDEETRAVYRRLGA